MLSRRKLHLKPETNATLWLEQEIKEFEVPKLKTETGKIYFLKFFEFIVFLIFLLLFPI